MYPAPTTTNAHPHDGLNVDSHNRIWFTEEFANKLAEAMQNGIPDTYTVTRYVAFSRADPFAFTNFVTITNVSRLTNLLHRLVLRWLRIRSSEQTSSTGARPVMGKPGAVMRTHPAYSRLAITLENWQTVELLITLCLVQSQPMPK